MTEDCGGMLSDEVDDSPEKCRERRHRRIKMRRLAATSATGSSPPAKENQMDSGSSGYVSQEKRIRTAKRGDLPVVSPSFSPSAAEGVEEPATAGKSETAVVEPVYGALSVLGRSREMEDAIAARTSLCEPEINRLLPVHFFAVYDGHGGCHVSTLCRDMMHVFIKEELMRVGSTVENVSGGGTGSSSIQQQGLDDLEQRWSTVMKRSFERMDEVATSMCSCGSFGNQCGCHSMEAGLCGSTAVVAVLTLEHIVVANCGDSRAVLCRAGRAIPLSSDHKPDRPDELARIEAFGGRVIFVDGARVEGILAMSRAIGDKYLKPVVTSEPDLTFTKREAEDDCLILASDGLWDVLSNDLACEVACECLRGGNRAFSSIDLNDGPRMDGEGDQSLYSSRSVLAATLLTRLALGRKSSDNISVMVVDLKRS